MKTLQITRDTPAGSWREGMPLGNGHLGVMYCPGIRIDTLNLPENTFFSGEPSRDNNSPGAAEAFRKMRQADLEGDYAGAFEYAKDFTGNRGNYGTNLPAGRLLIEYEPEPADAAEEVPFVRTLDYRRGIASVSAGIDRELFVSHPAGAMFCRIRAKEERTVSLAIRYDPGERPCEIVSDGMGYTFTVRAYESMHSNGKTGVTLTGTVTVSAKGGKKGNAGVRISEEGIRVYSASEVVIVLAAQTDYGILAGRLREAAQSGEHTGTRGGRTAGDCDYRKERDRHAADISRFMDRMEIDLKDPAAEELVQFGRYLLVCSSREDSWLPAHLQGVWNDNVACRIGWTCDMHLDINTQMNYWLGGPGALPECEVPLFSWMEECLIPSGREAAERNYGLPGWCAELVSNAWGYASPYWARPLAPYPAGGIWAASAYWEHYLFTGDKEFLRDRAYPVLKETAEFVLGYVFENHGRISCGPSVSPENRFVSEQGVYYMSHDCTHEVTVIRELLTQFLKASGILGQTYLTQKAFMVLGRLAPFRILPDGTLAEYAHDYPAEDPQHRHTAHLQGLFPYAQITPEKTPELAGAARRSINGKLALYENWEDTGWARSLLILYAARLKDGEDAYRHLKELINKLVMENGMVKHPPTRGAAAFDDVYELDGNTGSAAGILEMLIQSHNDEIEFLPALPKAWSSGYLKGVRARGGVTADLFWENGQLLTAVLTADQAGCRKLKYHGRVREMYLSQGEPLTVSGAMFPQSGPIL